MLDAREAALDRRDDQQSELEKLCHQQKDELHRLDEQRRMQSTMLHDVSQRAFDVASSLGLCVSALVFRRSDDIGGYVQLF